MNKTLTTALAFLVPALAWASGGEGAGNNPFAGDVGTALWTLIIFLLVIFVLGKFAWGPILDGLKSRETYITDSLRQAKEDREAAEARLKEYEERLAKARAEATALVEEGRRDAEVLRRKLEAEAKEESDRMIARARREIGLAKETAVRELYATSAKLATEVAEKVIRKDLSGTDHQRLIADAIEELQRMEKH